VKVDFYSESYCPGCESYSTTQLQSTLTTIGTIVDFRAFPYGNANEKQNADGTWSFTCQHGVNECIGNMYEACAIEHNNSTNTTSHIPTWWPFYYCMEKSGNAADTAVASACAKNNGLDWSVITACSTTTDPAKGSTADGNPLMHKYAVDTNNLVPPHQWTPWVVVNGTPLTSNQLNLPLTPIVCKDYTSNANCKNPPPACAALASAETKLDYVDLA
jgi:interferon gamma-inducible protein 30